jgi:DNA-binding MarR family transcriptional regulator
MHTMDEDLRQLHDALLDLSGLLNRPQADSALIAEAGIELDRALFPLLVRIDRRGPIGVVDLADLAGRDHTTVSRQVAKLESLGLVERRPDPSDGRVRLAAATPKAQELTRALDDARQRLWTDALSTWTRADRRDLVRLIGKLADQAMAWARDGGLDAPRRPPVNPE